MPSNTALSNFFFNLFFSPKVAEFIRTREIISEIDLVEVSAAMSSVSCSGLLMGLQNTRFCINLKPSGKGRIFTTAVHCNQLTAVNI